MSEPKTSILTTGAIKVYALGDRAVLEAYFELSKGMRRALCFVVGVSSIWALEQCLRWALVLGNWLAS